MTLQAQDARQQVVTKAVHHRHDDDERGDGERDPGQRQDRNERNEPVLAPRPQVAKRDHPLEAGEGAASGGAGALVAPSPRQWTKGGNSVAAIAAPAVTRGSMSAG